MHYLDERAYFSMALLTEHGNACRLVIASNASAKEADSRQQSGGTAYDVLTTLPRQWGTLSTGAHQPHPNTGTGT